MILDSGTRRTFDSGAVRDMSTPDNPKGRCDLMPLEVVRVLLGNDSIMYYLAEFLKSNNTQNLYSALIEFAAQEYGGSEETMLLEVAIHYELGSRKYGPDNWRRSIPTWSYIDSACRHYIKHLRGDDDEFHNRSFVWNLMCCIWEVDYHNKEED